MTDFLKKLASMALPSWMNKGEPLKLLKTARTFWAEVYDWITWPLRQFDPLTCIEPVLNLIAYDRDITRFSGEPLSLFRKRVAYAFINARDAGSVEGFINIFERLGIGYVELVERQPDIDWDVILVRVTDPLAGISLFLPLKRLSLRAVSGALARSAFSHTQSHP